LPVISTVAIPVGGLDIIFYATDRLTIVFGAQRWLMTKKCLAMLFNGYCAMPACQFRLIGSAND
jgi:hypothetical protein